MTPAKDHKTAHKADAKPPAMKAQAEHNKPQDGSDGKLNEIKDAEHVTQNKPALGEVPGSGPNARMSDVGEGSFTEDAPAMRSGAENSPDKDRVVKQGDEVIVHGRALLDGNTEARGLVLKINQDSTIAVRIPRGNGTTFDLTSIHNRDLGTGESWWEFPAEETLTKDLAEQEKQAKQK